MRFIGVDLAWSERNPSGVAVLEGDEHGASLVVPPTTLTGVAGITQWVGTVAGSEPAFVAVDAPLWVPNDIGRRPCEVALARDFARFHAGPHPANRSRLAAWDGSVAGERLAAALQSAGFSADPCPTTDARSRRRLILEAFPHPAIVVLFRLDQRLLYKKGTPAAKRAGLTTLRELIRTHLTHLEPPLVPTPVLDALCAEDVEALRGAALKGYEDRLDALICAYIAYWYWYWGAERCRMYGTIDEGHIIVPSLPERA
jgi:predicted RNase H-like nuclease